MATLADGDTVNLTDFHKSPGLYVDQSQLGPVVLTKRNRRFAAVVSADWFNRAEEAMRALHGNRRVYTEGNFPNDFAARLEASLPTESELAADRWDRERIDTAA